MSTLSNCIWHQKDRKDLAVLVEHIVQPLGCPLSPIRDQKDRTYK